MTRIPETAGGNRKGGSAGPADVADDSELPAAQARDGSLLNQASTATTAKTGARVAMAGR